MKSTHPRLGMSWLTQSGSRLKSGRWRAAWRTAWRNLFCRAAVAAAATAAATAAAVTAAAAELGSFIRGNLMVACQCQDLQRIRGHRVLRISGAGARRLRRRWLLWGSSGGFTAARSWRSLQQSQESMRTGSGGVWWRELSRKAIGIDIEAHGGSSCSAVGNRMRVKSGQVCGQNSNPESSVRLNQNRACGKSCSATRRCSAAAAARDGCGRGVLGSAWSTSGTPRRIAALTWRSDANLPCRILDHG